MNEHGVHPRRHGKAGKSGSGTWQEAKKRQQRECSWSHVQPQPSWEAAMAVCSTARSLHSGHSFLSRRFLHSTLCRQHLRPCCCTLCPCLFPAEFRVLGRSIQSSAYHPRSANTVFLINQTPAPTSAPTIGNYPQNKLRFLKRILAQAGVAQWIEHGL